MIVEPDEVKTKAQPSTGRKEVWTFTAVVLVAGLRYAFAEATAEGLWLQVSALSRPQQCCKEPCWGPPSKGDGLTRYTMRTSCSSISTFFTKARTTSRRVSQSGSCNSWETRFANSSNWPITSRSSTSWLASSIRCRHSSSSLARRSAPPRSSARIPTCRATRRRRHRSIVKSSFLDLQSSC